MAPKTGKGKGAAKNAGGAEPPENELVARQTELAYFPSMVGAAHLWDNFRPLWGGGDIIQIVPS